MDSNPCLLKCHPGRDFIFVSYSSKDAAFVLFVVQRLQECGYNMWIDEANLDKSKDSWKDDALRAIEDINCMAVLFFVSRNSLTSEACLNELDHTRDATTVQVHFRNVDVIVVEVEPIDDITSFMATVAEEIKSSGLSKDEQTTRRKVLSGFKARWFPNNEKVRVRASMTMGSCALVVDDIRRCIKDYDVILPLEELCMIAVDTFRMGNERLCSHATDLLRERLGLTDMACRPSALTAVAGDYMRRGDYAHALACYLIVADMTGSGEYFHLAAKQFLVLISQEYTVKCLSLAVVAGHSKSARFHDTIRLLDNNEFKITAQKLKKSYTHE